MSIFRDVVSFVLRPWALAKGGYDGTGRWITVGGTGINDDAIDDKSALSVATYFACIRNIGEDLAKLPFCLIRNEGKKRIRMDNDPLTDLFCHSPNPRMTAFTFRATMVHWAAGWGNAYAQIVRNGRGDIAMLNPVHPSRVFVHITQTGLVPKFDYQIYNNDGSRFFVAQEDMFHLYGMSGDGQMGYSVVNVMMNTLGLANVVQRFARNFYSNSARPAGILQTPNVLKPEARANLAQTWMAMYSGPMNAGKTAVLEAGIEYKGISLPMKDMEFIELRKFQKQEIASWFRMPLYKLQDVGPAQGWSTLDAQETDYVSSCLLPWVLRFEQEVRRQLMDGYDEAIYPHLEIKGLMRGDMTSRKEFYKAMFAVGAMTPNEIRSMEDMDPLDDPACDKVYIPANILPIDKAGQTPPAVGAPGAKPKDDGEEPKEPDDTKTKVIGINRLNGVHHA